VKQLEENLRDVEKGPLPEDVLKVLDQAWEVTRNEAPSYWHLKLEYGYGFDDKE